MSEEENEHEESFATFDELLEDPNRPWQKMFPWAEFRKYQEPAIQAVLNGFKKGKRYAIVEGPTGFGKTVMALTLARAFNDAYIATHQKMLQAQYMKDFSQYLAELRGRSNYPCLRINFQSWTLKNEYGESYIRPVDENADYLSKEEWEKLDDDHIFKKYNCANAPCCTKGAKDGRRIKKECKSSEVCEYIRVRDYAMLVSKSTVMNFSNLLLFSLLMPKPYSKRSLLILDEAHTLESFLYDYASTTLTTRSLKPLINYDDDDDLLRLTRPFHKGVPELMVHIEEKIVPLIDRYLKSTLALYGEQDEGGKKDKEKEDEFSKTENERDRMMKVKLTLKELIKQEPTDHSHVIIPETDLEGLKTIKLGIKLKPFSVAALGPKLAFKSAWDDGKVLLMSATILDSTIFCRSLGIPPDEAFFIRVPSTFPAENRLVIGDTTVGSMSYKNKDETLPKMCSRILDLSEHYHDVKGIIHTGNYEIMHKFKRWAKQSNPELHNRIQFQAGGTFAEKMEMIRIHEQAKEPLIICGPGFTTGIDLKDDLARFNLIMKLPFLSLADPLTKRKSEEDSDWYTLQMFLSIIQAIGRVVRSDTDHGDTIILDMLWNWMYKKHKHLVPPHIQEAIRWRTSRNMNKFP